MFETQVSSFTPKYFDIVVELFCKRIIKRKDEEILSQSRNRVKLKGKIFKIFKINRKT